MRWQIFAQPNAELPAGISQPSNGFRRIFILSPLRVAITEVYPALWSRSFARADRTRDQHDAYSIAAWLSRADQDDTLAAFLKPDLTPPERAVAQVEGWILGVA